MLVAVLAVKLQLVLIKSGWREVLLAPFALDTPLVEGGSVGSYYYFSWVDRQPAGGTLRGGGGSGPL